MAENKKKVIATNTIIKTVKAGERGKDGNPGTKPVVDTIPPGAVFMADAVKHHGQLKSEYEELLESGAIRDWSQEDEDALNRLSNVRGGGEFTDNFRVSETVISANDGQSQENDPSLTGQQQPAARKSTAPAPKQPAKVSATDTEAEAAAKKAEEDAAAADAKKAEDAAQAKASANAQQSTTSTTSTGKSKAKSDGKEDDVI